MERKGTERQLGHVVRKGKCIFDIIVLIDNRWSRFGGAEGGDCGNFNCGDALLVFIFAAFRRVDWRTDVDDGRRLLGDTGAGNEAIDDGLNLGPPCLAKIHFDIPVRIIEVVVPVSYLSDTMYCFIFRKVEVGIGPFLPSLCWGGDSNHVGEQCVLESESECLGIR